MSDRWRLAAVGAEAKIYVQTEEYGEVLAGVLYLSDEDIAELAEMFRGCPA